jgi:transglutaminase-like putative cysteine protease
MEANKKYNHSDTFFLLTVGVLLAWSLIAGMINVTLFSQSYLATLIQIFFIVVGLRIIFSHQFFIWASIVGLFFLLIFIAIGFFTYSADIIYYAYYYPAEPSLANQVADFISRTIRFINGNEPYSIGYERAIIWVVSIVASLFVVIFSYLRFNFWILFTVTAVIFSLFLASPFFIDNLVFYVFAFCSLAFLIKHLHLKCMPKSQRKAPFAKYALGMTIFCLLVTIFIPTLPAGLAQSVISNTISRPFHNLSGAIYQAIEPQHYFSLRRMGFGDGGQLGGNVIVDDRLFMRIRSDSPMPIYLTGATMDAYTGYSWENIFSYRTSLEFTGVQQNIELYERATSTETIRLINNRRRLMIHNFGALAGAGIIDLDYLEPEPLFLDIGNDNLLTRTMDIDTLNLRTSSIFFTGIVQNISVPSANINFLRDGGGRIVAQERMPRNTLYTITYSVSSDISFMNELGEFYETNLLFCHNDFAYHLLLYSDNPYNELGEFYETILPFYHHSFVDLFLHQHNLDSRYFYRGALRTISHRMLAQYRVNGPSLSTLIIRHNGIEISYEDLLNYYLIPRADRIYEVYTALPTELPERIRDLALSVTSTATNDYDRARMLEAYLSQNFVYTLEPGDLPPGRDFVDYFLFDLQKGYCTYFASAFVVMARSIGLPTRYVEGFMVSGAPDGDGFINVLNSMGHAWGEVYFEGYGWIRFEPTPAAGLILPLPEVGFIPSDYDSWDEMLIMREFQLSGADSLEHFDIGDSEAALGFEADQFTTPESGADSSFALLSKVSFYAFIAVVLISLIILARVLQIYFLRLKIKQKRHNEAVLYYFELIIKYLGFFNYEIKAGETANQFATRVNKYLIFASETLLLKDIAAIFSKANYSNHDISLAERKMVEDAAKNLDSYVKNYLGRRKYFFYKYILAIEFNKK